MARTLFGVIYDRQTLQIRRTIVPHDDSQLALHVGKGEDIATGSISGEYNTETDGMKLARDMVRRKTGREPPP